MFSFRTIFVLSCPCIISTIKYCDSCEPVLLRTELCAWITVVCFSYVCLDNWFIIILQKLNLLFIKLVSGKARFYVGIWRKVILCCILAKDDQLIVLFSFFNVDDFRLLSIRYIFHFIDNDVICHLTSEKPHTSS